MISSLMKVTKTISIDVPGLGAKIKEFRETDSRSLKAICEAVGMSQMNWYRIEEEKQSLPLETLRKIEEVLGVDFGVNLEGEGNV
jgi:transcriptional regulator with XRE-family HTH domain